MIAEARGSVGGTVFSRNQHGAYTRYRAVPVNPATARQTFVRQLVEDLQAFWRDTLTQAQRDAWEGYAAGSARVNKLGFQTFISGVNAYIAYNVFAIQCGLTRRDDAPTNTGSAGAPLITISATVADGLRVTGTSPLTAVGQAAAWYVSPAKPQTVNFFKGPFVSTVALNGVQATPIVLKAPALVSLGQKYFVGYRFADAQARLSEKFVYSAIVV